MYQYDEIDQRLVEERVARFRDQTRRFLAGELSEDDFRPFRLQNGLYIQRHAPMLRVAIPYGVLSASQLRRLAWIARTHDRGVGHFTTRQNIQYNWVKLPEVPIFWLRWPKFRCMPRKPAAIVCAIPPPTIFPGWQRMN